MRWIHLTQAIQALLLDDLERRLIVRKCDNTGCGLERGGARILHEAISVNRDRCNYASILRVPDESGHHRVQYRDRQAQLHVPQQRMSMNLVKE